MSKDLTSIIKPVLGLNPQLESSGSKVDEKPGIGLHQLQGDKVRYEEFLLFRWNNRTVVEEDTVGLPGQELDGEVGLFAQLEGRVPRPPLAPERPGRLLAPGAFEAPRTLASDAPTALQATPSVVAHVVAACLDLKRFYELKNSFCKDRLKKYAVVK